MSATRVHINPDILTWAIRRVGKDVDEYAQKDTNFQKWIEGSKLPTMKNIEDFAKKFYVPLVIKKDTIIVTACIATTLICIALTYWGNYKKIIYETNT